MFKIILLPLFNICVGDGNGLFSQAFKNWSIPA